ncbi:MAG: polysaccharide deacetylase family protein [Ignavibacteriales bacterium]|nr:polysaccharide deacetylase family protein [Ignavibacteriales bacterium]
MKKILLTIDTEFIISKDEILGINGKNGIDDILIILNEFDIKATFFIDYYEINKWGESIFEEISNKIKSFGHQIELHLHPNLFGDKPQYIWQYSKSEQEILLDESINFFKKINSTTPKYFRAGGYSADDVTLEILKKKNFIGDLSFQHKQKRCKISKEKFNKINQVQFINDLLEIPTTVYKYNFPKIRYNSINLEWCSLSELKNVSKQIKNSELDYFVLMMHSFSFLKRWDRKKLTLNNSQKRKFRKYLKYVIKSGFEFVTVNKFYSEVRESKINVEHDFTPYIKNPLVLLSGAYSKLRLKFIVNKKFRRFFIGTLFSLPILLLIFYILLFPFFEPSYSEIDNVKIDTETWNADNNIHTIENNFIDLNNYKKNVKSYLDSKGIIYRNNFSDTRKYILKPGIDTLYVATDMAGQLIKDYTKFKSEKDSSYLNTIYKYSDWLKTNVEIRNDFAIWPYHFKFTKYDMDYDWCGSWALGTILSSISRRIEISGDSSFINLAEKTVNTFETKIEDGGILYVDEDKNLWFEEYPTIPPNHVLNGHITGLFGLYDYWRITDNKKAKILFDLGIKTVVENLDKYDSGYWSYYDQQYPYLADYYYHKGVHIPQLKVLYQITGKKIFKEYVDKWENYLSEPYFTIFKLKLIVDGLHRRFVYKSFFTLGK